MKIVLRIVRKQMISIPKIKFPHKVIVRAPGLLPMLYTLKELASALDLPYNTLRGWLSAGAPHEKDDNGRLWINGELFAAWVINQKNNRKKQKLSIDQGYCMHCNQARIIESPQVHVVKGKVKQIKGFCPVCKNIINKGIRDD